MTTEYLLDEQAEHVLALLTPVNRLAMRVALHTGLRISDVLSLKKTDIDKGLQFGITEKKTGKRRRVTLTKQLWEDLRKNCGEVWVFQSRIDPQKHRSRQAVWRDVKRAQQALRLPQNIGPHSARKIYAVQLWEDFGSIPKVRRALNHSNDSTTMIYAMAAQMLKAKYAKKRRRRRDT